MPRATGYSTFSERLPPGLSLAYSHSAHSKSIFQGFMSAHRFPTSAATNPMPTHQIIQMKVGAKFKVGV